VCVRPDARHKAEEIVPRTVIVGVCDLVQVAGGIRTPIEERPHNTLAMLGAILRPARSANQASARVMYVYDFGSNGTGLVDTPVRFEELTPDEIRDQGDALSRGGRPAPNGGDTGCVVGTLSGRQVYHVWYVRGDGARLHGLPPGWQPRGRVLFLHGGYTEPDSRSRGIHTAALRWLLARERHTDTAHAVGVVNADNVPARRAVESAGFHVVGHVT